MLLSVYSSPGILLVDLVNQPVLRQGDTARTLHNLLKKCLLEVRTPVDPTEINTAGFYVSSTGMEVIENVRYTWKELMGQTEVSTKDVWMALHFLIALAPTGSELQGCTPIE